MDRTIYRQLSKARRCHGNGSKGFRLNSRRFTISSFRSRFVCLFRILSRWRFSYGQAFQSLKKCMVLRSRSGKRSRCAGDGSSKRSLVAELPNFSQADYGHRLKSFRRSNSFYAEAIADCLEFIKRSSISFDQNSSQQVTEFHNSSSP